MISGTLKVAARRLVWTSGVAALILFTSSGIQAQPGSSGTPPKTGGSTPGTGHPAGGTTNGGTKTPVTTPHSTTTPVHSSSTTTIHSSTTTTTIHPSTTTTSSPGVIVISPNSTTSTTSPTTTEPSHTATRLTLPASHALTSTSLGSGRASSPVSIQPAINTNPYYQLQLQNALLSPYAGGAFYSPAYGSIGYNTWNPYGIYSNPYNPMNPYSLYNSSYRNMLGLNSFPGVNPILYNPYESSLLGYAFGSGLTSPYSTAGTSYSPFGGLGLGSGLGATGTLAVQQPSLWINGGPNLSVNPITGTVVQPLSGYAMMSDGSTYYRLPGSISHSVSPVYYNPVGGTLFNPQTGVVAQPLRFIP